MLACLLTVLIGPPAFAQDNAQTRVAEILEVLKAHPPRNANEARTAESIERLKELAELGPDAASAVPFLLSEDFFLIAGGYTATDKPLRLATIDTLVRIGEPAVPDVIKLLSMPKGRNKFDWNYWGKVILRKMAGTDTVEVIIPALVEEMRAAPQKHEYYQLLASFGPKSIPVLQQEARDLAAKKNLSRADANNLRRLGHLLGGDVGSAIDAVIPERYNAETWADLRYWIHYRGGWYPLAHARPDAKHIPAFLDLIKDDSLIRQRQYEGVRYVGMILSMMGDKPALPLAALLDDTSLETRWAAAYILAMLGPDGKAALPALEKVLAREEEVIEVRVAAARAIAEITGSKVKPYYDRIPNLHERLVAASRNRSRITQHHESWQEHFATDPDRVQARQLALYNRTPEAEKPIYYLATNQELKAANDWVRQYAAQHLDGRLKATSFGDGKMSEDLNLFLYLFGAESQHYPGRLEADVEQAAKEYAFRSVDITAAEHKGKPRYVPKSSSELDKILALDKGICIVEATNGPLRSDAQHYLILQTLNSDPKFRNRKFKTGDTVAQRFERFTQFFRRGLKEWALHGMWVELGSSNYEYKTYRGLFLLLDFAKDPIVATRARMLMDLALIEIEQISLSGLRGGSKSRAKDGGLDGRFNRYLGMLYGEHHGYMLEPPGFKAYRPPEPSILLRRLGPTTPIYEISNRHPGETIEVPQEMIQGNSLHKALSRSINYAYRTSEYVTGCSMFDVRHWKDVEKVRRNRNGEKETYKVRQFGYGPLGRWSGVIFRDGAAVYMDPYTGEKWNVQSGDVMIAQRYPKSYYQGEARVDFAAAKNLDEKDGWVFVDNRDAYAAVNIARGGYYWNEPARHRLYLNDQYSPIIIQAGRKAVYDSFATFQQAILNAPLTLTDDKLDYTGPNSARIEFFLAKYSDDDPYPESLPKIDGKELDLDLKYNYHSPYMENKVGSDIVTIRYGARQWDYNFAKNTVIEVTRKGRPIKERSDGAPAMGLMVRLVYTNAARTALRLVSSTCTPFARFPLGKSRYGDSTHVPGSATLHCDIQSWFELIHEESLDRIPVGYSKCRS